MEDTREQTIDWAIKFIISGTGLIWLRDAFNACCKEQEENYYILNNIGDKKDDVRRYLNKEPMIKCIANKNIIKYEVRNSILDSCQKHLDIVHSQKLEQVLNQIIANPELTELSIDWKNENK